MVILFNIIYYYSSNIAFGREFCIFNYFATLMDKARARTENTSPSGQGISDEGKTDSNNKVLITRRQWPTGSNASKNRVSKQY